jgi:calcineurin-like phosphoesterase family protein
MNAYERAVIERDDPNEIRKLKISRESTDRMNDGFTDLINRDVGEKDVLWILGDFAYPKHNNVKEIVELYRFYRNRFNCRNVHLIWGNHDPDIDTGARKAIEKEGIFSSTADLRTIWIDNQAIMLSHYAMAIWRNKHYSAFNFYGHSHSNAEDWLESIMPGRFSIDVGVDNAKKILGEYRPFCYETELLSIIQKKDGFGLKGTKNWHHKG